MIRSDENPWIVVTTGVVTRSLYVSGRKSNPLWMMSNSPARSNGRDVQALCDLGVDRLVLRPARRRGRVQPCRGDRVCSGEQGDLMTGGYQPLGEQRRE